MQAGALTGYFDVAQITLYGFWIFFAGVVYYCHREDKREGYPLVPDATDRRRTSIEGFPFVPSTKVFLLPHGKAEARPAERPIAALPSARFPGAPLIPTGNPMIDGVGPAAYAMRADVPDVCFDDRGPKIVPLRAAPAFSLAPEDPDPRGMEVVGADNRVAGRIVDVWVDRSEYIARYLEAELTGAGIGRRALIPMTLATVRSGKRPQVRVRSITAAQFADVPRLRQGEQITLLEEDKIVGYFGGGTLYAQPSRAEPLL